MKNKNAMAEELAASAVSDMGDIFFDPDQEYDGDVNPERRATEACKEAVLKAFEMKELICYQEPRGMNTLQFTVILLYPDYLSDTAETYLSHVDAGSLAEAVEKACKEAANDNDVEDPDDFLVLFACPGHQVDLSASMR